ncbi:hypothetical protein [Streptomyces mirabilis]|uniref:hypothetical protein n=1 Tax=Streptomyces mirabilis TaxID=68239 RepID=UPI002697D645|nr:hypothetical protein [Streptomyces mirabilis]
MTTAVGATASPGARRLPGRGVFRKLGVEQIDLLILRPAPDRFEKTIAAYKALEALLANGDHWS